METPLKYMFLPDGFNNSKLAVLTPVFYMYMVIMFIAVMVASAGRQLLLALIFSIAGNRLARILNTGLSYGKVFTICVYAQTLAVFIMSVNTALGYLLSSFVVWIIALVVSMVFMNKAIGSYVSGDKAVIWFE
jgi:membrane-associated HD superfamily phosphohydrolase